MEAVFVLKKFRMYLLSNEPFTVVTDYQALQCIFKEKDIHDRLAWWLDILSGYEFKIIYRPEISNCTASVSSSYGFAEPVLDGAGDKVELLLIFWQTKRPRAMFAGHSRVPVLYKR